MDRRTAEIYRRRIEEAAVSLPDEDALTAPEMFKHWVTDIHLDRGERVYYDGKLYRVEQSHDTQEGWTPNITPALFTEVSVEEWPEWKQPTGAQDAYMVGDKVSHNEKHWVSTVDSNVWEPGVFGWDEV
jgi:hypothetical protein